METMLKNIYLNEIEIKAFKKFEYLSQTELDKFTVIVARNKEGKSSILNAIAWTFVGSDMFGSKMVPFHKDIEVSWVQLNSSLDQNVVNLRRISERKGSKVSNLINHDFEIDKDLFLAISNPRYVATLSPKDIKELIAKIVVLKATDVNEGIKKDLLDNFTSFEGHDSNELLELLEKHISIHKTRVKSASEEILIETGKIDAYRMLLEDKLMDSDVATNLTNASTAKIESLTEEKSNSEKILKISESYKKEIYKALAKKFNETLRDTTILLESNGKEVFEIEYKGMLLKSCSNSEQLFAGLDIVNAISKLTNCKYPCLIDNAESIVNLDPSLYENIPQFICAIVADEDLSLWKNGELKGLTNEKLIPRSKKSLIPTIKLLDGWGVRK